MDLATIGDMLGDFSTFGKNIGTAFQAIPQMLLSLDWLFNDGADVLSSNTEAGFDVLSSDSE